MSGDTDEEADFHKRIEQIEESEKRARGYLERTTPKTPRVLTLPLGAWTDFAEPFKIADSDSEQCNAEGRFQIDAWPAADVNPPPYITRCVREKTHDGVHASKVHHRRHGRLRWRAYVWNDAANEP